MDTNQKNNELKLTIKKVKEDISRIMEESKEADKQQMFFRLMKRLVLPTHSSDVHARALSSPEMYDRLQEWIRNEESDQRAQKMVLATVFAAMSAAFSAVCSLITILRN